MGKDVLTVARGELGNTESPAGSNRTKYGAWMKLDGQPFKLQAAGTSAPGDQLSMFDLPHRTKPPPHRQTR